MTTVGSLAGDLAPGNEVPGKSSVNLPPSPTNSVPYIIATSADDDKNEKPGVAPVNGGSPMRYLQACSKLDMEPNPFEQSFAGTGSQKGDVGGGSGGDATGVGAVPSATGGVGGSTANTSGNLETPKPILPSIEAMSGRLAPGTDQFGWDAQSLRMGPLSPSMLEGPQNPIAFDNKSSQNPLPLGSFPPSSSSTASLPTLFTSGAGGPLAENSLPFVGVPGPLPLPPPVAAIQTSESYSSSTYNQPPPSHPMAQHLHQQASSGPRPPNGYGSMNGQGSMNNGPYGSVPQPPPPHGPQPMDGSMNGYGNLHLLSQAQATHREMWIKREGPDANGGHVPNGHPTSHPHGSQPRSNGHPGLHQQPPRSGQPLPGLPGMPAMVAAPQLPKDGIEPAFVRGVRRSRVVSEDNSDDSDKSKQSGDGGAHGSSKKKQNTGTGSESGAGGSTGYDKMDEEEKRKNFLERNRQAALKCRQRKKQWLANLQQKVEYLTNDNEHLQNQTVALRDEIIHLKALLLAHKDCPVAQANGVYVDTISLSNHQGGGGPGGMMGQHDRPGGGYPMQQPGRGAGGPPSQQPRGSLPPPPPPSHLHAPMPGPSMGGLRIGHQQMASGPSPGPMGQAVGGSNGRPMAMMQDITPSASPSQSQANVRY
ncbi:hypothetical protein EDD11_002044 [Mortierella claussenii]|nr:hypothetical protein EDD11_002044 [Mortierella claussenii]